MVWQKKAQPRYNVVSMRVSAEELAVIDQLRGNKQRSALMRQAFELLVASREEKVFRSHGR